MLLQQNQQVQFSIFSSENPKNQIGFNALGRVVQSPIKLTQD